MKFASTLLATVLATSAALAAPLSTRAFHGARTFDDTNGSEINLQYSKSDWHHDSNQPQMYDGVISYSQDPSASYSFSTKGYSQFEIYSGLKGDRGGFTVAVDGQEIGYASQWNPIDPPTAPMRLFFKGDLDGGAHTVTVSNSQNKAGDWMAFNYVVMAS